MPTAEFQCPHCSRQVRVDVTAGEERARCPDCGGVAILDREVPRMASGVRFVEEAPETVEERDIAAARPTWRSHPWLLFFGILLTPAAVGLFLLAWLWIELHSVAYRVTNQRILVTRGLISRTIDEVELFRVKDVTLSQTALERILKIGTVTVLSTDDGTPELKMAGIAEPERMKDSIREHCLAARRRERVRSTEFIQS